MRMQTFVVVSVLTEDQKYKKRTVLVCHPLLVEGLEALAATATATAAGLHGLSFCLDGSGGCW